MTRQGLLGLAAAALVIWGSAGAAGATEGDARGGRHRVRGEVVSVDEARGSLTLKTGEGSAVALHLPPAAVKGFRKGDRLTLDLAVDRAGAAGSRAAKPAPARGGSPATTE